MLHKTIHKRQISGTINDDKDLVRMKMHFMNLLLTSAEDEGLVPVLDIDPSYTLNLVNGHYDFKLTVYFIHIGKKKAKLYAGISENKLYLK